MSILTMEFGSKDIRCIYNFRPGHYVVFTSVKESHRATQVVRALNDSVRMIVA